MNAVTKNALLAGLNKTALTANGAATNYTSGSDNVDLFFQIGASRGKDLSAQFKTALAENAETASRIILWARDARKGQGERDLFRSLLAVLIQDRPDLAIAVLEKTPEIGRYDDLLVAVGTLLEDQAIKVLIDGYTGPNAPLAAKWTPVKGPVATLIRKAAYKAGIVPVLDPAVFRKFIVNLRAQGPGLVETKMCAGEWDGIEYGKVPSRASQIYKKAFLRHNKEGYAAWAAGLATGEAKINASVLYPYEITTQVYESGYGQNLKTPSKEELQVLEAAWKALPNYLAGSNERIIPVVDLSGSMMTPIHKSKVQVLDVAVSLGLYLGERLEGPFKDTFISFSERPTLHFIGKGDLTSRVKAVYSGDVGYSTNVQAVFDLILKTAVKGKVPESDMPTKVLLLSDMEFNACTEGETNYEAIKRKYAAAGYNMPQVVFWNLNARAGNSPVTLTDAGTALVSGFSPSIMTSVLGAKAITPQSIMEDTVYVERYDHPVFASAGR